MGLPYVFGMKASQEMKSENEIAVHLDKLKMVPIGELKPHPKNMNRHTPEQIDRLAKILQYQGWRYPIKVSLRSGFITSGHGRLEAAKLLGLKDVPVSFQRYDDEDQEFADIVSDNAIAEWSQLDFAAINAEIANFDPSFDIDLLGLKNFVLDASEHGFDPSAADKEEKKHKTCPHCGEPL